MRRRLLTPLIFILVCAFGGLALTVATDSSPELGLDLQGGVSVVLRPTQETESGELDVALEIIRQRVDALGVAEPEIVRQGDAILVQLPGVKNRDRALELVGDTAELRFRPVLLQIPTGEGEEPEEDAEEGDETTTTTAEGATTSTTGGETTTTTAATSTSEGALGGGYVEGESAAGPIQEPTTTTAPPTTTTTTAPGDTTTTTAPPSSVEDIVTKPEDDDAATTVYLPDKDDTAIYQLGPMPEGATGAIVESADAEVDTTGRWTVSLTMKSGAQGIDIFNALAAQCYGGTNTQVCNGSVAITLDSIVQSAPRIEDPSYTRDQISISGDFTEREAKDLALVLRYGALPVELERETVQTVSASLGEDSLRAGVIAGLVGVALVALYMVFYYRALGIVVILGLGVWGSLLFSIISWLGESRGLALTLSGVTGIIVSVGVTVDSYVVFFERLKDEVKAGRTLRSSTERAFKRAYRTIIAADVASFLGAAILWWLTVGSVRGFAFFLGLSTVLDMVVAWFFTRPVVTMLSRSRVFTEAPVLGVARGLAAPPSATSTAVGGGK